MARLKVLEVCEGFRPEDVLTEIRTYNGNEPFWTDRQSLTDGTIKIKEPIQQKGDWYKIQLPRECCPWFVWVHLNDITLEDTKIRLFNKIWTTVKRCWQS